MKLRLLFLTLLLLLATGFAWSWTSHGIVYDLLAADRSPAARVALLKDYFQQFGGFAPLVYFVFVVIEVVVAPVPGLMLYAPGGILFGPLLGGTLALAGNVVGAGLACLIARSFGRSWLTKFFAPAALERVQETIQQRGVWLILLLRLNPLTSSDIVSYAAGFTRIPVWKVMLATAVGMAPLCFAQAWLANGLLRAFPHLIYPLLIACLIYVVAVLLVVRNLILNRLGEVTE